MIEMFPDDIIVNLFEFVGKDSYMGFGSVNRKFNEIFKTHSETKTSSYGGYENFELIIERFERSYTSYMCRPEICRNIAVGIVLYDRKDLLDYAIKKKVILLSEIISCLAAENGRFIFLKNVFLEIVDKKVLEYIKGRPDVIAFAASAGYLRIIQYLFENGFKWNHYACYQAARHGHLDSLKFLYENGCECYQNSCNGAAENGNLECLKFLHETVKCKWNSMACYHAAANGHINCLTYLHEQGCEWNSAACDGAAANGHLNCLQYLHKNGCKWDDDACSEAARCGHLECLKFLHEHGCGWNERACEEAAYGDHLDCLQYMQDNGLEWYDYKKYLGL